MRSAVCLIFILFINLVSAQEVEKQNPFFTIRGNIGIPKIVGSQMFRTSFNGVYEANLSFNFKFLQRAFVGVGYQNNLFVNNRNVFIKYRVPSGQSTSGTSISYDTQFINHAGFLKFGYDKYFSNIGFFSYALNAGYTLAGYKKIIPDTSQANQPFVSANFSAPYVQPEISANFLVEKFLSFSLMFSYTTVFYKFNPKAPRFNQVQQVQEKRNNYPMNWINLGFGFTVLID